MEKFWSTAQPAISRMLADLPLLASFSVKSGVHSVDIQLVIKSESEQTPDIKKKKPSPSRLRRNQRRLLLLLERNKEVRSEKPDNSGTIAVGAGKLHDVTGVASTPVTQREGTALSTTTWRENANSQVPSPTLSTEGEGANAEQYNTHDDASNNEEDSSDQEEDASTEEEDDSTEDEEDSPVEEDSSDQQEGSECTDSARPFDIDMFNKSCDKMFERLTAQIEKRIDNGPLGRYEPTTGSPDVMSSSVPSMNVDNMDISVQDTVLSSKPTVKVSCKEMDKTLETSRFATVTRKSRNSRKKRLSDPNTCKTN